MSSDRPRIQGYIDPDLYHRFNEWREEQGLKESPAINQILKEYFGMESQFPILKPQSLTKDQIDGCMKDFGDLVDLRLDTFQAQIDSLKQAENLMRQDLEAVQSLKLEIQAIKDRLEGYISYLADEEEEEAPALEATDPPKSLNGSELARRLGIAKSVISTRKDRGDFQEWSRGKDPEAIAWKYDRKSLQFFPISAGGEA